MLDAFFINIDPEPLVEPNEQPEVLCELNILLRFLRQNKDKNEKAPKAIKNSRNSSNVAVVSKTSDYQGSSYQST